MGIKLIHVSSFYRKKILRSNNELKKYLKENPEVKCATNVTSTHLPFDLKIQKSDSANSPDGKDIAEIAHVKQYMQVTPKRHYYTEALSLPYDFEPSQEKSDATIPKG